MATDVTGALAPAKDPKSLLDAAAKVEWVEWMLTIRWDYWATGTWKWSVSRELALQTVKNWLRCYPDAYALVGVQCGPHSESLHVHVVVGGVGRSAIVETHLRGSWIRQGHMDIKPYTPLKGGVAYLVGQAAEIEIIGSPLAYAPRKRRRRGGR